MRKPIVAGVTLLIAASLASAPALAQGTRYKWRDAEGNLHYSDALPADAGKLGYDVVNAHGVVIKRVEAAKTPEQRAIAKAAAEREQASRNEAEARLRKDQQMLAAYPTERELLTAHEQQLQLLQQNIESARNALQNQERNLAEQLGNAADIERDGKAIPPRMAEQISTVRKQIEAQHGLIERRQAELAKAKVDFAAELEHYRSLQH